MGPMRCHGTSRETRGMFHARVSRGRPMAVPTWHAHNNRLPPRGVSRGTTQRTPVGRVGRLLRLFDVHGTRNPNRKGDQTLVAPSVLAMFPTRGTVGVALGVLREAPIVPGTDVV